MRETIIKTVPNTEDFIKATGSGWGCGYVYIPNEHPILVKLITETNQQWNYCLQPKDCEQEITYSAWNKEQDYYVIGFDTAHSYNNSSHDENYVTSEAQKIKAFVDAYTLQDAHNEAINCIEKLRFKLLKYIIHE